MCHFTMNTKCFIFIKYFTTQAELLFAQSLQSICSVYVDPAGDRFLYHTTWYTKVNMVIIELYKARVTQHVKYIEGKWVEND